MFFFDLMDLEIVDVQVKGCTYMDIYIYICLYTLYIYYTCKESAFACKGEGMCF